MKELEEIRNEIKELKYLIIEESIKHNKKFEELKKFHTSHRSTISLINGRLKNMIFRGVKFD